MDIKIQILNQKAKITNRHELYSGTVAIEGIQFEFSDEWADMTKTATVYVGAYDRDKAVNILIENERVAPVQLPSELFEKNCELYVGVFGIDADGRRLTSSIVRQEVKKGVPVQNASDNVSIDVYTRIIQLMTEAKDIAADSNEKIETNKTYVEQATEQAEKSKQYAESAESHLADVETVAGNVSEMQKAIEELKTAAEQSASDASTSELNASQSEQNALASELNAEKSEQNASKSATDASTSASNAKKSETAAATSEQNARKITEQLTEDVSQLKEDISDLTDTIISIDKSNVSENVDNYENIESTIIKSNGKLESNSYTARFVVKKYINLTKASYTVKGFCQGNQCLYVLCDKNGNVIKYEDSTSQGSYGTKTVDITIDERDTTLYVGGYETVIAVVKKYLYDVKLTTRLSNIYRKKVTLNGDSIAFGAGTGGTGFMDYIASKYNMTLDKKAVSGATIANLSSRYPDKHCICTSIDTMAEDANYIIFEGGYNDWLLWTQIGTITDTMSGDLDDTKFYGALESICRQALAKWENGKIGFIITHKINDAWRTQKQEGATYPTLDGYYQAIKNVCEKYSIPYLDLSKVSRLNTELQNYKKYTYNSDGVHPTKDGYQIFYVDTIARWMENL